MKRYLKYADVIVNSPLWGNAQRTDILSMLNCLCPIVRSYSKNEYIIHTGEQTSHIGMVLSGNVHIQRDDYWGNLNIMTNVVPGGLFAEVYACTPGTPLQVDVVAADDTIILFMELNKIMTTCSSACSFHSALIRNLLSVIASRNILLNEKLSHVSQRTTRDKLLSYLFSESRKKTSKNFTIPYNRQQLADYLSVDRSSLSRELSKMNEEGILSFKKNHFILHNSPY